MLGRVAHGAFDTLLLAVAIGAVSLLAGLVLGALPACPGRWPTPSTPCRPSSARCW
jgi:ABC-type dipeptide/oligopeptide/nickel transport system permease subunit